MLEVYTIHYAIHIRKYTGFPILQLAVCFNSHVRESYPCSRHEHKVNNTTKCNPVFPQLLSHKLKYRRAS